jgi:hypothetical protein
MSQDLVRDIQMLEYCPTLTYHSIQKSNYLTAKLLYVQHMVILL